MKKIVILTGMIFSITLFVGETSAQERTYPINLESVLKLAGADNLVMKEYELKYQESLAEWSKAKEWWLPSVYFGATTHYLNGAAMNTDGQILTDVQRNNLWGGLGIAMEWDFSKGIYSTLAAKQKADGMKYQSQAERNQAILKAIIAYYDLLADQLKYAALLHLVNQSDTLTQQIKIQVDAGLRYQSEYLLALSNYNHLKISLIQTKAEWQKKSAELSGLLNLSSSALLASTENPVIPLKLSVTLPDTSSQNTIFEKRPEYLGLQSNLFSMQTQRKAATTGLFLPRFRLGTDDALFGRISSPYYNTYQLNASLVWSLPLGRFTYNGDVKRVDAQILIQQNEMEQFTNQAREELWKATAELQSAEEQMKISKESLTLSAEAMQQSVDRQKLGTAKPFEVFQAQQFFLQAQADYLKAVTGYNKAQYLIYVAMGNNL